MAPHNPLNKQLLGIYPPVAPLDDRSQLIRDHMPLIELIVQRMTPQVPSFMTKEDMTSAAMVGLVEAANKFDPAKNIRFKTFAEYRIRGAIFDEMRKLDWFSRSLREKQNQLAQAMLNLERKLGRTPEEQEIADELEISMETYREMIIQVSHLGCVSLNQMLDNSQEGRSFLDNLPDEDGPAPSDMIENHELTAIIADVLHELTEKERLVIALYYYEELTQKEISTILSVSEGRVSQLHSQALIKLRVKLQNKDF